MYGSQEQGGYMDMLMQAMMSQEGQQAPMGQPTQMPEQDEMQTAMASSMIPQEQPSPTIGVSQAQEAPRMSSGYPGQGPGRQNSGQDNPFGDLMSNWNQTLQQAGYGEDYGEDNEGSYLSEDDAQTARSIWEIISAIGGGGGGGGGG